MRHNDIGDQKIDCRGIANQIERGFAASRFYYLVPFVAQGASAEDPDRIVILDKDDGTVPGQILYRRGFTHISTGGLCRIRRLAARQINLKNRALARPPTPENKTPSLLNNAATRHQT